MAKPIRVLIVDANAIVRTAIVQMLAGAPDIEITGQATEPDQGLHMTRNLAPDVIIMDLEVPDGACANMLRELMKLFPTPVIGLGTPNHQGGTDVLAAFAEGVVGYLPKTKSGSSLAMRKLAPRLIEKVRAVGGGATRKALISMLRDSAPTPPPHTPNGNGNGNGLKVIGLCAGAGGPYTLMRLVASLPENLEAAVMVAQTLPEAYTGLLAERLHAVCALPVREAGQEERLTPGTVLVGQGGKNIEVKKEAAGLTVYMADADNPVGSPSADGLLHSLAAACPADGIGVVLSGMGEDGVAGTRALIGQGGVVLTQTPDDCLVCQMPEASADAGAIPVSMEEMTREILARLSATDLPVPQSG